MILGGDDIICYCNKCWCIGKTFLHLFILIPVEFHSNFLKQIIKKRQPKKVKISGRVRGVFFTIIYNTFINNFFSFLILFLDDEDVIILNNTSVRCLPSR